MRAAVLLLLVVRAASTRTGLAAAQKWFLTEEEVIAAMKGFNRTATGLSLFTLGNEVSPRVDGASFMANLHADWAQASGPQDFVHAAQWNAEADEALVPSVQNLTMSNQSKLINEVKRLVEKDVEVRWLENRNTFYLPNTVQFAKRMNEMREGIVVTDARFPEGGSVHQKAFVVRRAGETIAYVGGIDIMNSRWNTNLHNISDPRRQLEPQPPIYPSWHDAMVHIRGPAVLDVERNFYQRWNDPSWPQIIEKNPKPYAWLNPPVVQDAGKQAVQIVRTYSCAYGAAGKGFQQFAPKGEMTAKAAYLKAISRAQRYIYIEDQFAIDLDIAKAIGEVLPRIDFVAIVTQAVPKGQLPSIINSGYDAVLSTYHRYQALFNQSIVQNRSELVGKVHWFNLTQPGWPSGGPQYIYVHAKQFVVDDEFAIVGSANVCRRSFTHDSQISAAITDDSGEFAGGLRRKLWGEHTMLSENDPRLASHLTGMQEMLRQADTAKLRLRHHDIADPGPLNELQQIAFDTVIDPDGDCH